MGARSGSTTHDVWQLSGGIAGLLTVALGILGGAMEVFLSGPWPAAGDPSYGPFLEQNRTVVITQSLLFIFGQGALLWFLSFVTARLRQAEDQHGALSMAAFGAGVLTIAFNIAASGVQLVLTMPSTTALAPDALTALMNLCLVLFAIANLPLAIFFLVIAVLSFTRAAFPVWLGWIAVVGVLAALGSVLTLVPATGPLSPLGAASTALRLVPILWYLPAAILMLRLPQSTK